MKHNDRNKAIQLASKISDYLPYTLDRDIKKVLAKAENWCNYEENDFNKSIMFFVKLSFEINQAMLTYINDNPSIKNSQESLDTIKVPVQIILLCLTEEKPYEIILDKAIKYNKDFISII